MTSKGQQIMKESSDETWEQLQASTCFDVREQIGNQVQSTLFSRIRGWVKHELRRTKNKRL